VVAGGARFWAEQFLEFQRTGWVGIPFLVLQVLLMLWIMSTLAGRVEYLVALALVAVAMVCFGVFFWSVWWMLTQHRGSSRSA
jgi:hypothetical protein